MRNRKLILEFTHNGWTIKVLSGMFNEAYIEAKKSDIIYKTSTSIKYSGKSEKELKEVVIDYLFGGCSIDRINEHKKLIDNAPTGSKVIIRYNVYDLEEARKIKDGKELIYTPVIVKPGEVKYVGFYVDPYGEDYSWGVFDSKEEAEKFCPCSYYSGEPMYLQDLRKVAP